MEDSQAPVLRCALEVRLCKILYPPQRGLAVSPTTIVSCARSDGINICVGLYRMKRTRCHVTQSETPRFPRGTHTETLDLD